MRLEDLVGHCLAKPGAEETHPWGEAELVAKVGGKAFAFIGPDSGTVGVKCGRDAAEAAEDAEASTELLGGSGRQQSRGKSPVPGLSSKSRAKAGSIDVQGLPRNELADMITNMNEQMLAAARELQFEVAARLRDELNELKRELRQLDAAHA